MDPIPDYVRKSVRASFSSTLEAFPLPLHEVGNRVVERLGPGQWRLEWGLPYWLGAALNLEDDLRDELILCNILGLTYIRLMDDFIDGEVAEEESASTLLLAHRIYQEAILRFVELFPVRSTFWVSFKSWMDEWLTATLPEKLPRKQSPSHNERDYSHLAKHGAPLKICCAAACLLGDRPETIPSLTQAVDYALVGLVLLDHFQDWECDLEAGRYNTFVEYVSDLHQIPENREGNRLRSLEALYMSDRSWTYLQLVRENLRRAREVDLKISIPQFGDYLLSLEARINAHYLDLVEWHRSGARKLSEMIFGPPDSRCESIGGRREEDRIGRQELGNSS